MLPFLEINPVCSQRIPVGILQPSFIREENLEPFCLSQDSRSHAALSSSQHHESLFIHFYLLSLSFGYLILRVASARTTKIIPTNQKRLTIFGSGRGTNGF